MSIGSRLPAFALLVLVLLVAALLIAGLGVAVAVGIIAGLLLGLANILAFLALNSRSSGGSVTWLSRGRLCQTRVVRMRRPQTYSGLSSR